MSKSIFLLLLVCLIISCVPEKKDKIDLVINAPADFDLEELYTPTARQGSWVSISEGPNNTLFTCDQYGKIYQLPIPELNGRIDSNQVEAIDLNMGYAQGLLWAFNSLYVVVVKSEEEEHPENPSSGVYRLTDSNQDGKLDSITSLLKLNGDGEHGPHTLRVGPDGQSIYLIAGNFNKVPDQLKSRLPRNWQEDNLFPPYLDARGHAVDLKAPGGWIAKTDPEGKEWELIGAGMRNPFSFGFNKNGDILAYDADMEWDFGMPWYRPTRILHVTSGAEFGWRTGSGKWPVYYPDNLPPVVNMAQGSPTAVIMGKDLRFPTRYRDGLFACDWSFGTIYFVDIQEEGSSYTGKKEEFLSGVPLPISNAIAGSDGNMYFLTGGRRLESHLYRVSYKGTESTARPEIIDPTTPSALLRNARREIEEYHRPNSKAVDIAWPYLSSPDRHIRYAARIALEHQPLSTWAQKLWIEKEITAIIQGALSYARADGPWDAQIATKLENINWEKLSAENKISLIRVYELMCIRQGKPNPQITKRIIEKFVPHFPSDDTNLNRELSQILLFLNAPGILDNCVDLLQKESTKTPADQVEILGQEALSRSEQYGPQIANMLANMPPTESIYYATLLSHVQEGWSTEKRKIYFEWFHEALSKKGGESYKAFIDNIRAKALENVPNNEKEYFANIAGFYSPTRAMADLPQPIGPGKNYNLMEMGSLVMWSDENLKNYPRTIEDGKRAFDAALCSSCHRMKGEGTSSGPDLTNLGTRFSKGAITNAILSPSEEISDQYAFTVFNLKNKEQITGRIVKESEQAYTIYQSPYDMTQTRDIEKSEVLSSALSALSPMPAQLLNRLNEDEVIDLFVYLLSGADENHEYYKQ